jgi:futalosine hydrolase
MKLILIIVAMKFEALQIEQQIENKIHFDSIVFPYVTGTIGNIPVAICVGGVGKINAAAATAAMIERLEPQLIINTGCAGAYMDSGLSIGDLVIANFEVLGDDGSITSAGWLDLQAMQLPYFKSISQLYFNEIPLSGNAIKSALKVATHYGIAVTVGRSATVSTCSGSLEQGDLLAVRCNAITENMEGAAVALTSLRYNIDCLEIRGISNMVEERNMDSWNIKLAVRNAQDFVLKYLEELNRTII